MTDKSARGIAARGHCRATCGYAKVSGAPCEVECAATDFSLLHGGHYSAVDSTFAALEAAGLVVRAKEPTGEMQVAGDNAQQTSIDSWSEPSAIWRAMHAASKEQK